MAITRCSRLFSLAALYYLLQDVSMYKSQSANADNAGFSFCEECVIMDNKLVTKSIYYESALFLRGMRGLGERL